jgi:glycerol-3-phosphate acyltransferase PlsY
MLTTYLIVTLVAYLLGSIPFGYILVKIFLKQDIRTTGSGNIGATNVARSGKKGLAIATLLLDAMKGALAVGLTYSFFSWALVHDPKWTVFLAALAGAFAILGHVFPVWLKFRGGKGVATAMGAFLLIAPRAVGAAFLIFVLTFLLSRYVSLASMVSAAVFPVLAFVLPLCVFGTDTRSIQLVVVLGLSSLLIILKHQGNIRRLLNGTEPKFGVKKPAIPPDPIQVEKNA